jgi:hypothetical protein
MTSKITSSNMSVTYDDFHGSPEAKIVSDKTTKTLGHNDVFIETLLTGLYGKRRAFLKTGQVREHERVGESLHEQ